jgi:predicted nuclease with TOPRIM domain
MRIATHPEAIKHLVKIGMAADISEHIKMVESANESLIKEKDELRSVAEDNKRECEATRIENARLKAEVERLTKAADEVDAAWSVYENGLIETPEWVKRSQVRDAVSRLWNAAKQNPPHA